MNTTVQPQTIYRQDYQPSAFFVDQIDLTFDLAEELTLVKSRLTCRRNIAVSRTADLTLNGESLTLRSITIEGKPCHQYELTESKLVISALPDECVVEIEVAIYPQNNKSLNGLYRSRNYFCTQCEPEGFRHITFFPDRPDVMAKYSTTIIADKKHYPILLSNGNPIDRGEFSNGKHWVKWEDPFKKPSYLFALVACDMDCLTDNFVTRSGRTVELRIYVEKGCLPQAHFAMHAIKKAMQWDELAFDREYDLDIYMIVAVSDFNMGAMENKGLNIFNDKYILATPDRATDQDFIHVEAVIAHEYFHNWTGNRITCRDWFQLSLKEGLTIFREQLFTSDTTSPTVARIDEVDYIRTVQFSEDNSPLAHAVQPDSYIEINNFYTATVYNKGAEVIRMLRTLVGEEKFREGMNLYFERHDGQAVTIEDFVRAHEDVSEADLKQFRLWYSEIGTPRVSVTDFYHADTQSYSLHIKQSSKNPLHIPIKIGLLEHDGREVVNEVLELREVEHVYTFENILEKPIPSLLRDFSAPVRLDYDYSDEALTILFCHDSDLFNRREAGVRLAINHLMKMLTDVQQNKSLRVDQNYIDAIRTVFHTTQQDRWLLARMLMLPTEKYLSEQLSVVDVDGIHMAREFLSKSIAISMKNDFLEMWKILNHSDQHILFDIEAIGDRALKNMCLHYLMLLDDDEIHETLGWQQFQSALGQNMTDCMAALAALVNGPKWRDQVLKKYYDRWHDNALALDKWFAIQASAKLPDTLNRVKQLLNHPAFDLHNPNKVYALIGSFGANAIHFHQKNGVGYQFLAEIVSEIDMFNPQVASRMVKPLITWRRYDPVRQSLMREALMKIANAKKLSPDLYEMVTKSLHTEENYHERI